MIRTLIAVAVAAGALLLPVTGQAGSGAVQLKSAHATLIRSSLGGNHLDLILGNTGDALIGFLLQLKNGFNITQMTVGSTSCATTGFEANCKLPIPAGTTVSGTLTTDTPYPDGAGGALVLEGADGSTATGVVSGPGTPTTPPPPTTKPCKCSKLSFFANEVKAVGQGEITIKLHWTLTCIPGSGTGCKGSLGVSGRVGPDPAEETQTEILRRRDEGSPTAQPVTNHELIHVDCPGPCNQMTEGWTKLWLGGKAVTDRATEHHVWLRIYHSCGIEGRQVELRLSFDSHGTIDYKNSDLNGDGKPDGGEL
jgi:hypothetical protein